MIELRRGDLLKQNAEVLVNAVNCVGVMGRGIALQFRKAFPENFKIYEAASKRGEVKPGEMLVFDTHQVTNLATSSIFQQSATGVTKAV